MLLHFADASEDYENSNFVIFSVPFDSTSSFRHGSKFAPDEIRKASYNLENYLVEHNISLEDLKIHDFGHIISLDEDCGVKEIIEAVKFYGDKFISEGKFPIMLGGEHSISAGMAMALPKNTGIIFIDAHTDFRDEYLGTKWSHAAWARRAFEILNGKVFALGVRSVSEEEIEDAKHLGYEFLTSYEIMDMGIEKALEIAMEKLNVEKIYLSIDIDGISAEFAPGTGTPEFFGLTPMDVKRAINILAPKLIGGDIVEINPEYDNGNTSVLGARLVQEIIATVSKHRFH